MKFSDDNFVINNLRKTHIRHGGSLVRDGDYRVLFEYLQKDGDEHLIGEKHVMYRSRSRVPVRGGLVSVEELIHATRELKELSGYWGKYLTDVWFNTDEFCLEIGIES